MTESVNITEEVRSLIERIEFDASGDCSRIMSADQIRENGDYGDRLTGGEVGVDFSNGAVVVVLVCADSDGLHEDWSGSEYGLVQHPHDGWSFSDAVWRWIGENDKPVEDVVIDAVSELVHDTLEAEFDALEANAKENAKVAREERDAWHERVMNEKPDWP